MVLGVRLITRHGNDCHLLIQADQVECVLTRINADSSDGDSVCLFATWQHAPRVFEALPDR
jgi:hypothetical protein